MKILTKIKNTIELILILALALIGLVILLYIAGQWTGIIPAWILVTQF